MFTTTAFYKEGCIMVKLDVIGGFAFKYLSFYLHINRGVASAKSSEDVEEVAIFYPKKRPFCPLLYMWTEGHMNVDLPVAFNLTPTSAFIHKMYGILLKQS